MQVMIEVKGKRYQSQVIIEVQEKRNRSQVMIEVKEKHYQQEERKWDPTREAAVRLGLLSHYVFVRVSCFQVLRVQYKGKVINRRG